MRPGCPGAPPRLFMRDVLIVGPGASKMLVGLAGDLIGAAAAAAAAVASGNTTPDSAGECVSDIVVRWEAEALGTRL